MTFALFKDGKQISKAHSTFEAVRTEAYEKKLVVMHHGDFDSVNSQALCAGYTIKEIDDEA